MASRNGTDVFLLEYQENNPQLDQWIEATVSDPNNPAVFLVFPEISTTQLWKALHLGVKECFTLPVQPQEFQEAVNRLLVRDHSQDPGVSSPKAKMIALLGCKGGIGATFLASNLAYLLSREHQGQVLLVDLDLQYAQMAYFFDVKTQHSLSEAVTHLDELDHAFCKTCFIRTTNFSPIAGSGPSGRGRGRHAGQSGEGPVLSEKYADFQLDPVGRGPPHRRDHPESPGTFG